MHKMLEFISETTEIILFWTVVYEHFQNIITPITNRQEAEVVISCLLWPEENINTNNTSQCYFCYFIK